MDKFFLVIYLCLLERGIGVERDSYHAAKWYQSAAKLGFPDALCALGRAYERGAGVPADAAKAAEMFGKATEVRRSPLWQGHYFSTIARLWANSEYHC